MVHSLSLNLEIVSPQYLSCHSLSTLPPSLPSSLVQSLLKEGEQAERTRPGMFRLTVAANLYRQTQHSALMMKLIDGGERYPEWPGAKASKGAFTVCFPLSHSWLLRGKGHCSKAPPRKPSGQSISVHTRFLPAPPTFLPLTQCSVLEEPWASSGSQEASHGHRAESWSAISTAAREGSAWVSCHVRYFHEYLLCVG